jgi:tetratricopeptide (TPR) repeat protein
MSTAAWSNLAFSLREQGLHTSACGTKTERLREALKCAVYAADLDPENGLANRLVASLRNAVAKDAEPGTGGGTLATPATPATKEEDEALESGLLLHASDDMLGAAVQYEAALAAIMARKSDLTSARMQRWHLLHHNIAVVKEAAGTPYWEEAAEHYLKAVELQEREEFEGSFAQGQPRSNRFDGSLVNLGVLLQRIPGRDHEAFSRMAQALHVCPGSPFAANNLAKMLSGSLHTNRAHVERALEVYAEAMRLAPTNAHAHEGYGMLRHRWMRGKRRQGEGKVQEGGVVEEVGVEDVLADAEAALQIAWGLRKLAVGGGDGGDGVDGQHEVVYNLARVSGKREHREIAIQYLKRALSAAASAASGGVMDEQEPGTMSRSEAQELLYFQLSDMYEQEAKAVEDELAKRKQEGLVGGEGGDGAKGGRGGAKGGKVLKLGVQQEHDIKQGTAGSGAGGRPGGDTARARIARVGVDVLGMSTAKLQKRMRKFRKRSFAMVVDANELKARRMVKRITTGTNTTTEGNFRTVLEVAETVDMASSVVEAVALAKQTISDRDQIERQLQDMLFQANLERVPLAVRRFAERFPPTLEGRVRIHSATFTNPPLKSRQCTAREGSNGSNASLESLLPQRSTVRSSTVVMSGVMSGVMSMVPCVPCLLLVCTALVLR